MPRPFKLDLAQQEQLVHMYTNENQTLATIAATMMVSVPTVCRYLKLYGVSGKRERKKPATEVFSDPEYYIALCDAMGYAQMSTTFGVSPSMIKRHYYVCTNPLWRRVQDFLEFERWQIADLYEEDRIRNMDYICREYYTIPDVVLKLYHSVRNPYPAWKLAAFPKEQQVQMIEDAIDYRMRRCYAKEYYGSPTRTELNYQEWKEKAMQGLDTRIPGDTSKPVRSERMKSTRGRPPKHYPRVHFKDYSMDILRDWDVEQCYGFLKMQDHEGLPEGYHLCRPEKCPEGYTCYFLPPGHQTEQSYRQLYADFAVKPTLDEDHARLRATCRAWMHWHEQQRIAEFNKQISGQDNSPSNP